MAHNNWKLAQPISSNVVVLKAGSDLLTVGTDYNFALPHQQGVLIPQNDFKLDRDTVTFERFARMLPLLRFKVEQDLGPINNNLERGYVVSFIYEVQLRKDSAFVALSHFTREKIYLKDSPVSYSIPTELIASASVVGNVFNPNLSYDSLKSRCLNFSPFNSTAAGFSGTCIEDQTQIVNFCSDSRAWNYNRQESSDKNIIFEEDCRYDLTAFKGAGLVNADATIPGDPGFQYLSIQYVEQSYGVYELWCETSIYIGPWQSIDWDLSYVVGEDFTANNSYTGQNGPTLSLSAGTHIIGVQIANGPLTFIDFVTIVVEGAVAGCTDINAFNYNPLATSNNGSCVAVSKGCMDNGLVYSHTYSSGGEPQEFINSPVIPGQAATNYSSSHNIPNNSCSYTICPDDTAANYIDYTTLDIDPNLNELLVGPCTYTGSVAGCTDPGSENQSEYNPGDIYGAGFSISTTTGINASSGSATVDPSFSNFNYNPHANVSGGRCIAKRIGCLDPLANNYSAPTGNSNIDVNWHIPSTCEYTVCSDTDATNEHITTNNINVTTTGVDNWGYKSDGSSWTDGSYWVVEDLGTQTQLSTSSIPYNANDDLCTYAVTVSDVCDTGVSLTTAVGNLQSNVLGYINETIVTGAQAGELNSSSANSCISQLTVHESFTGSGVTYNKITQERVKCQVIDSGNPVLYLTNPEVNGEVRYSYTGNNGGANITLTDIHPSAASGVASALSTLNYSGTLTSSTFYYFRIVSPEENINTGLTLTRVDDPISLLFADPNITKVDYNNGGFSYIPGGTVSNFQTASSNTTIPAGYALGTINGFTKSSTVSGAGGNGLDCSHASLDNAAAAQEKMYTIYRVEVENPCSYAALNFVIDADTSLVPDDIVIQNTPVFEGSTVGCMTPGATNYNSVASISNASSTDMASQWDTYLATGGCYVTGCVDEYYANSNNLGTAALNNLIVGESTIIGQTTPLQIGAFSTQFHGTIYRIYNGYAHIVDTSSLSGDALTWEGATDAASANSVSYGNSPATDWMLPDAEDLVAMYNNLHGSDANYAGVNFTANSYWSSNLNAEETLAHSYNFASGPSSTSLQAIATLNKYVFVRKVPVLDVINEDEYISNCMGVVEYGCTDPAADNYNPNAIASPVVGDTSNTCVYDFHIDDWSEGFNNYNDIIVSGGFTDTLDVDGVTILNTASENWIADQPSYSENVSFNNFGNIIRYHYSDVNAYNSANVGIIKNTQAACLSDLLFPYTSISVASGTPATVTATPSLPFGYNLQSDSYTNRVQVIGKKNNTSDLNWNLYATNPEKDGVYNFTLNSGAYLASNNSTLLLGNNTSLVREVTPASAATLAEEFADAGYVSAGGGFTRSNVVYYFRFDKNLTYAINPATGAAWNGTSMLEDIASIHSEATIIFKDRMGSTFTSLDGEVATSQINYTNTNLSDPQSNGFNNDDNHLLFGNFLSSLYVEPIIGEQLIVDSTFPDNNAGNEWIITGDTSAPFTFVVDAGGSNFVAKRTNVPAGAAATQLKQTINVSQNAKYKIVYKKKVAISAINTSYFNHSETSVRIQTDGTSFGEADYFGANDYMTDASEQTVVDYFVYTGSSATLDVFLQANSTWEGEFTEFTIQEVDQFPDGYITQTHKTSSGSLVACSDAKTPAYYTYTFITPNIVTIDFEKYFDYGYEESGCMDETALNYNAAATITQGNYTDCLYFLTTCDGLAPEINVTSQDSEAVNGVGCSQAYTVSVNGCPTVISNAQISMILAQKQTNTTNAPITLPNGDILAALSSAWVPMLSIADIEPCIEGVTQGISAQFQYDPTTSTFSFANVGVESNISYITNNSVTDPITGAVIEAAGTPVNPNIIYTSEFQLEYNEYYLDPVSGETLYEASPITHLFSDATIYNGNPLITPIIDGCTNSLSFNYNENATCDDNSCTEVLEGCTDPLAFNYSLDANTDDGSCVPVVTGCVDPTAFNYNYNVDQVTNDVSYTGDSLYGSIVNVSGEYGPFPNNYSNNTAINSPDNSICFYCPNLLTAEETTELITFTHTQETLENYTPPSTTSVTVNFTAAADIFDIDLPSTTEVTLKYDQHAVTTNGGISAVQLGIIESVSQIAFYSYQDLVDGISLDRITISSDDPSKILVLKEISFNVYYNSGENGVARCLENVSGVLEDIYDPIKFGCLDSTKFNYHQNNTYLQGSEDIMYINADGTSTFQPLTTIPNVDNGQVCVDIVEGCTDSTADLDSFNPDANINDGSCLYLGCTNPLATNYDSQATDDDGSCLIEGCMETWAANYDITANVDTNKVCVTYGCTDQNAYNSHFCLHPDSGCFDNSPGNYTSSNIIQTGTCFYQGCMDDGTGVNQEFINLTNDFNSASPVTLTTVLNGNTNNVFQSMGGVIPADVSIPGNPGESATNYNSGATISGTCYYDGCTDANASNYDPNATTGAVETFCVYEACVDSTATNYGEGLTVTGNVSGQSMTNSGFGPELLAPLHKLSADYWKNVTNTTVIALTNKVKVETNSSYSGGSAARVVLSPFNPQAQIISGVLLAPITYSILEYDSTVVENTAGVLSSIEYPQITINSDILVYSYLLNINITNSGSGDLTVKIKEYKSVATIAPAVWVGVDNLTDDGVGYSETATSTALVVGSDYKLLEWTPHYETELVVVEISDADPSSSFVINDISLKRSTDNPAILDQAFFDDLTSSGVNITLGLDNAEFFTIQNNNQNSDPFFHALRTYINAGAAYTGDQGLAYLNPNTDLFPFHTGSVFFADTTNETYRRSQFVGDNPVSSVKITPFYEAKFRVSKWETDFLSIYFDTTGAVNTYTNPDGAVINEPRAVLSSLGAVGDYGDNQFYRLNFQAKLGSAYSSLRTKMIGISDHIGTPVNYEHVGSGTRYMTTPVNPDYAETEVGGLPRNTIPNNVNRHLLNAEWTEYTIYWMPGDNASGIALFNSAVDTDETYEFLVKNIQIQRVELNVFNTETDLCYVYGCGASGLEADGTTVWATNYNADVNSEIGIDVPFGTEGPNGEQPCYLEGCTTPGYANYNEYATIDNGSCALNGCTDSGEIALDTSPYVADITTGLIPAADNYTVFATSDDGTCAYTGCMDPVNSSGVTNINYNALYTVNDSGSCIAAVSGCSDKSAANFSSSANTDITDTCCLQLQGQLNDAGSAYVLATNTELEAPSLYFYDNVALEAKPVVFELYSYNCTGNATVGIRFKAGYSTLPDDLINEDNSEKVSGILIETFPANANGTINTSSTTFADVTLTWDEMEAGVTNLPIYSSSPSVVLALFVRVTFTYSNYAQAATDGVDDSAGSSCTHQSILTLDTSCASVTGCTDDGWSTTNPDGYNSSQSGFPVQSYSPTVNLHSSSACGNNHVLGCMDTNYAIPANQYVSVGASSTQTSHPTFNKTVAPSGNDIRGAAYDGWSTSATINMYDDTYAANSAGNLYGSNMGAYHPLHQNADTPNQMSSESTVYPGTPGPDAFEGSVYGCFPAVYGCIVDGKFNKNNWYHAGNINPLTGVYYTGNEFNLLFGTQYGQNAAIDPTTGVDWTTADILANKPYLYNVNTEGTNKTTSTSTCFNTVGGCTDEGAANFVVPNAGSTTAGALAASSGLGTTVNTENFTCCYNASDLPTGVTYPVSLQSGLPSTASVIYDTNIYNTLDFTSGWANLTTGTSASLSHATIFSYSAGVNVLKLNALATLDPFKEYQITLTSTASTSLEVVGYLVKETVSITNLTQLNSLLSLVSIPNNGSIRNIAKNSDYALQGTFTAATAKTMTLDTVAVPTGHRDIYFKFTAPTSGTFTITNIDIKEWKHPKLGVTASVNLNNWPASDTGVVPLSQIVSVTAEVQNASNAVIYNSGAITNLDSLSTTPLYIYKYNDAASNAEGSGTYNTTYSSGGANATNFVDPNLGTKIVFTFVHESLEGTTCTSHPIVITKNISAPAVNYGCTDTTYLERYLTITAANAGTYYGSVANYSFIYSEHSNPTLNNGTCLTFYSAGCANPNYIEAYEDSIETQTGNFNTLAGTESTYSYLGTASYASPTQPGLSYPNTTVNIGGDSLYCSTEIVYGCLNNAYAEHWGATSIPTNTNTIYGLNSSTGSYVGLAGSPSTYANVSSAVLLGTASATEVTAGNIDILDSGCGNLTPAIIGCATQTQQVEYTPYNASTPSVYTTVFCNYDSEHNIQGLCAGNMGCVDPQYIEFNGIASTNTSIAGGAVFSCDHQGNELGSMNSSYDGTLQQNPDFPGAAISNSLDPCSTLVIVGCADSNYTEYNPDTNTPDNSLCLTIAVAGCTDDSFCEYYSGAQLHDGVWVNPTVSLDGACQTTIGCTNYNYAEAYNESYDSVTMQLTGDAVYGSASNGCNIFYQSLPEGYTLDDHLTLNASANVAQYENAGCTTLLTVGCTDNTINAAGDYIYNFNIDANLSCVGNGEVNGCCIEVTNGCTDGTEDSDGNLLYFNYNPNATVDDGTCQATVLGCTNSEQYGYNSLANLDDGSCVPNQTGCLEASFSYNGQTVDSFNFEPGYNSSDPSTYLYPNQHDDSECLPVILGCTDVNALNFNNYGVDPLVSNPLSTAENAGFINVNTDDGSCLTPVTGCMDPCSNNYNASATVAGACEYTSGCLSNTAYNYDHNANQEDGSCLYCEDWNLTSSQINNNTYLINNVSSEDGSITLAPLSANGLTTGFHVRWAAVINGSPVTLPQYDDELVLTGLAPGVYTSIIYSDTNSMCAIDPLTTAINPGAVSATVSHDGGNCGFEAGATEVHQASAPFAVIDHVVTTDGVGCTDTTSYESTYSALGSLNLTASGGEENTYTAGATTSLTISASNVDSVATVDDGSCVYPGCTDVLALNYNTLATLNDGTCEFVSGCTDTLACNYNPEAVLYGPCTYSAAYRDCFGVCTSGEPTESNPFGESLQFPGLCPEQVLSDCTDINAINFGPIVNESRSIPVGAAGNRMRIIRAPIAIEDDGTCIYENPCVPKDIYEILDALADTVNASGKTVLTNLRTGMLSPADTATMWGLMLVDYLLNKVGAEFLFNCADYNHSGKVTYNEGVDSINYFDRFLTFAFKNGDEQFTGVGSNLPRRVSNVGSKAQDRSAPIQKLVFNQKTGVYSYTDKNGADERQLECDCNCQESTNSASTNTVQCSGQAATDCNTCCDEFCKDLNVGNTSTSSPRISRGLKPSTARTGSSTKRQSNRNTNKY